MKILKRGNHYVSAFLFAGDAFGAGASNIGDDLRGAFRVLEAGIPEVRVAMRGVLFPALGTASVRLFRVVLCGHGEEGVVPCRDGARQPSVLRGGGDAAPVPHDGAAHGGACCDPGCASFLP